MVAYSHIQKLQTLSFFWNHYPGPPVESKSTILTLIAQFLASTNFWGKISGSLAAKYSANSTS